MKMLIAKTLLVKERLSFAISFSLFLHAFVIFGIAFDMPDATKLAKALEPLEVTLVNSKSKNKPSNAKAYAQHNLDGGGNTDDDRRAGTPFPVLGDAQQFTPEQATQKVKALEEEIQRLLTRVKGDYTVEQKKLIPKQQDTTLNGQDLVQRSLEIIRLEAEISKNISLYEKMPKRKFLGARVRESKYALYEDAWRAKIEHIGTLNYPEALRRQNLFGSVLLTVNIRFDGSLESVDVDRSSGNRLIDAAAVRIAKLAAPYPPFPPEIRKEYEILSIPRTWTFTTSDQLEMR